MDNDELEKKPKHLRAKIQIGSIKGGSLTYKPQQAVFHQDDIPIDKRNRRNEVKSWTQSNILSIDKSWNKSTAIEKLVWDKKNRENFDHDRSNAFQYNFRSEVMPPTMIPPIEKSTKFHISTQLKSTVNDISRKMSEDSIYRGILRRTEELPVNPKLNTSRPWNASTEVDIKERNETFEEMKKKSLASLTKKRNQLVSSGDYVNPEQTAINMSEEVRRQKALGTFSLEHKVFQPPPEPVDRKKLVNRYAIEASRKYRTTAHSGVWEFNKAVGKYMWSDTGSFERDSPGDIVRVHNPDKYIFEGPTLAPTSHNNPRRIKLLTSKRAEST